MIVWILFFLLIFIFLALDLGVFNKNPHVISYKEATKWTIVWTSIGLSFTGVIYAIYTHQWIDVSSEHITTPWQKSIEYFTGYIIELTLSIDNIFVIAMIFRSLKIPQKYQHRVLFWGIVGALVFRGIMIGVGAYMIAKFTWTTYIFGAFLIFTALKMLFQKEDSEFNPNKSKIFQWIRKIVPISKSIHSEQFFIKRRGILIATPLFIALIFIEFSDVIFALDSIPAILGITTDPFIVFSSNIFAILGLRSMYFFVANMLDSFHYLKYSLIVILTYVGIKLVLANHIHFDIEISLLIIFISIIAGILLSLYQNKKTAHLHNKENNISQ